jgi:hypothetical protein
LELHLLLVELFLIGDVVRFLAYPLLWEKAYPLMRVPDHYLTCVRRCQSLMITPSRPAPLAPSGRRYYHAGSAEPIRIAPAELVV